METGNALNEIRKLLGVGPGLSDVGLAQNYVSSVTSAVAPAAAVVSDGLVNRSSKLMQAAGPETSALVRQLTELTQAARKQAASTEANTLAVIENSIAQESGGAGSKAKSVGRSALSFIGSGFGVSQLLWKIFDRQETVSAAPAPSFALPAPLNVTAAISGSQIAPHPLGSGSTLPEAQAPAFQPGIRTPVTIQVNALDSRSFMDHSAEIAHAVKDALLNSHSLNDVVAEL